MAKLKSFTTKDGDMFYINHDSDNFTIIDCCIDEGKEETVINEIINESKNKDIRRFISTHPDDDHIRGLNKLNEKWGIINFYCVNNNATKKEDSDDFKTYCNLRDSEKVFHLEKGCKRKWMNITDEERGSAELFVKWPIVDNKNFVAALKIAEDGGCPNNISPIIIYKNKNGSNVYWFGDIETDFMEKIMGEIEWEQADIIVAPHHGRKSGKLPSEVLDEISPKIILIGDAQTEHIDYYGDYETITQNTADDIVIEFTDNSTDFYVSNNNYSTAPKKLHSKPNKSMKGYKYIGSISHGKCGL